MHHRTLKRSRSPVTTLSTKFKGVVPQVSGHWGAQIYANHQRVWLGTFKSEKEAAMAYDSAAIKLRSSDSHRNFPWSPLSMKEPVFQKHYSTEAVLNMIKDGSYSTKFFEFLKQQHALQAAAAESGEEDHDHETNNNVDGSLFMENNNLMVMMKTRLNGVEKFNCRKLFRKELTPSDVGKLNRLVIPKKFAVKFFPGLISTDYNNNNGATGNQQGGQVMDNNDIDVLLSFYDPLASLWKFRYCYWKSSQSFVFTRGWNRFVKEKKLKAKDVITFFVCEGDQATWNDNSHFVVADQKLSSYFYLIKVSYHNTQNNGENIMKDGDADLIDGAQEPVQVDSNNAQDYTDSKPSHLSESEVAEEEVPHGSAKLPQQSGTKKLSLRLFGVDIQN
ncbi:unnamed protein product [Rhodiola kirilowii]